MTNYANIEEYVLNKSIVNSFEYGTSSSVDFDIDATNRAVAADRIVNATAKSFKPWGTNADTYTQAQFSMLKAPQELDSYQFSLLRRAIKLAVQRKLTAIQGYKVARRCGLEKLAERIKLIACGK